MTQPLKHPGRLSIAARAAAFLIVAALILGFALYAGHVSAMDPPDEIEADGIIVLTGGEGRLPAAFHLLENGMASRLLVSGVNPNVSEGTILSMTNVDEALFACCVELGREAADTVGNAREAEAWAEANGFDRLIIVTSDFHMPRAILELRASMPDRDLIAWPVASPRPWESAAAARRWATEYFKFSAVFLREMARGRFNGDDA